MRSMYNLNTLRDLRLRLQEIALAIELVELDEKNKPKPIAHLDGTNAHAIDSLGREIRKIKGYDGG